jgi:hypothetical protein
MPNTEQIRHKNEGITASSEGEPLKAVLDWGFREVHKVMTEAVVGISCREAPTLEGR